MAILILVLSIVFIAVGIFMYYNCRKFDWIGVALGIIGCITGVASLIAVLILTGSVINQRNIDKKIELYTEQNAVIEQQIQDTVEAYMSFEKDVMTECAPESAITLVAAYPELASDELVKTQINTYVSNNKKIIDLKTSKINGNAYRWWLYFGGF